MWRIISIFVVSMMCLTGLIVIAATIGDVSISFSQAWQAITFGCGLSETPLPPLQQGIVWQYRVSRAVMAGCAGIGLSICGVVLQALLRNPLAEPYLLGISAGASTGAVTIMLLGLGVGMVSVSGGAFIGACCAFLTIFMLSRGLSVSSERIVLSGVAGTQLFNALTAYVVSTAANAEQSRTVMFWLLGSLSSVRWPQALLCLAVVLPILLILMLYGRRLDTLTLGQDIAQTLGTSITRLRITLLIMVAVTTSTIVSVIGAIGFVGLVVPHIAKYLVGSKHQHRLPAAALIGAMFMILADIVSRVLIDNQVLPIGVVTALVGSPAFAVILYRRRH